MNIRNTPLYAECWNVAWRKAAPGSILCDRETPFTVIENPLRYWAADPFVVEREGRTWIFAELYDCIRGRGILGVCELIPGKRCRWEPVLTEPFHLSYPCILEYDGKIYLMPESASDRSLRLYEAAAFPQKWKRVRTLREGVCFADTTPMTEDGLALAYEVSDPWNPRLLVIDLTGRRQDRPAENQDALQSRPAGKSFPLEGRMIRPVQHSRDLDRDYGRSLIFSRITWQNGVFRETPIREIQPEELRFSRPVSPEGMHTYNAAAGFEVIDIKTRRFCLPELAFRILRKFRRM